MTAAPDPLVGAEEQRRLIRAQFERAAELEACAALGDRYARRWAWRHQQIAEAAVRRQVQA